MTSKVVNFMRSNYKNFKPDTTRICDDSAVIANGTDSENSSGKESGSKDSVGDDSGGKRPGNPDKPTKYPSLGEGDRCCLSTLIQYSSQDLKYSCSFQGKGTYFFENQEPQFGYSFNGSASFHFDADY